MCLSCVFALGHKCAAYGYGGSMDSVKSLLEQMNVIALVEHVRNHYGVYGIVTVVVVALVAGVYLGYTPEQILSWLGMQ